MLMQEEEKNMSVSLGSKSKHTENPGSQLLQQCHEVGWTTIWL
jgi:hypothetical protein